MNLSDPAYLEQEYLTSDLQHILIFLFDFSLQGAFKIMDSFDPLLQDWRVDTTIDNNGYRHHKLQSGPECWKEVGMLGDGGHGVVWQEFCLSGRSKNSMRAVKHVFKREKFSEMRRELNALVTFSDSEFPEVSEWNTSSQEPEKNRRLKNTVTSV